MCFSGAPRHVKDSFLEGLPPLQTSPLARPRPCGALSFPRQCWKAAERGKALFHSGTVGCAACHGGPDLTNNQSYDVGTGGVFQVPQLHGLKLRAP